MLKQEEPVSSCVCVRVCVWLTGTKTVTRSKPPTKSQPRRRSKKTLGLPLARFWLKRPRRRLTSSSCTQKEEAAVKEEEESKKKKNTDTKGECVVFFLFVRFWTHGVGWGARENEMVREQQKDEIVIKVKKKKIMRARHITRGQAKQNDGTRNVRVVLKLFIGKVVWCHLGGLILIVFPGRVLVMLIVTKSNQILVH